MSNALPDRITHGKFDFRILHRPNRRTLEITVERDASLSVKAPDGVTVEQIHKVIGHKQDWIYRKLSEKHALLDAPVVKQPVTGEGFAYLGRTYRLLVVNEQDVAVKLDRGRLCLSRSEVPDAAAVIQTWYATAGKRWLQARVTPWCARMGLDGVEVRVMDLGFRWGSTRGKDRVNLHWAVLQLQPSLIDYILVHEIGHLHEANHTARFWRLVERAMPDYTDRHERLAATGGRLWLGSVA